VIFSVVSIQKSDEPSTNSAFSLYVRSPFLFNLKETTQGRLQDTLQSFTKIFSPLYNTAVASIFFFVHPGYTIYASVRSESDLRSTPI
jgi:hypothetical protein